MTEEELAAYKEFTQGIIAEFRANQGKVGGMFEGMNLVLLTTVGARSGLPRTSPVGYLEIDGELVVVASAGGGPTNPAWYHNLLAHPRVTVEIGTDSYQALASVPQGEERDRIFAAAAETAPGYADYQAKTRRVIPVVVLRPQVGPDGARARGLGVEMVEIHNALRAELAAMRAEVDAFVEGRTAAVDLDRTAPDLTQELRTHCLTFCHALEVHHTGEDKGAFPVLAEKFPALRPTLSRLRDEHAVVARLHAEIRAAVEELSTGDPVLLRARLIALSSDLERHFAEEEETLVAALNAMGPAPDRRG